jgi:ABC-2 type transport system ATP-binding protein
MAIPVIELSNLSFSYQSKKVLNNISLQIEEGSLFGFLGHNGAGKTTTIKILLSLLSKFEGTVKLFGKDIREDRIEILKSIGALVEYPGLYPHLSGYENLAIRAKLLGVPSRRINAVLETVEVKAAGKTVIKKYSQGMKQRLGIALALLPDPDLLLLDEPTNGLDPDGIREIRELLESLCKRESKTVFVSSHLLDEVEKMATHIGIIKNGNLLYNGTMESLKANSGCNVSIETNNTALAFKIAQEKDLNPELLANKIQLPDITMPQAGELNTLLVNNGITVYAIEYNRKSLEQLYFNLSA